MIVLPAWGGRTVLVLGAGSSAREIAHRLCGQYPTIAINRSFEIAPTAEILYAADCSFWQHVRAARDFTGLKITCDERARPHCPSLEFVEIPYDRAGKRVTDMQPGPLGTIGSGGGNSGFQAVNIAVQAGASRILLGGIDYCGDHWHGAHPRPMQNPSPRQFEQWRAAFDAAAPVLAGWDIDVVNLSPVSTLRGFRRENCRVFDQTVTALQA